MMHEKARARPANDVVHNVAVFPAPDRGLRWNERDPNENLAVNAVQPSIGRTAAGRSWNFASVPAYLPDRPNRQRAPSPITALPSPVAIQRKLAIGRVDDPLEREADAVAERVMRMSEPEVSVATTPPQVSRKCAACEEEEKEKTLQTKPAGLAESATREAPPMVHEVLRSPGQPLEAETRAFFEPRFGRDFSRVRVHADERAAESARAVNALAYTVGRDVVFGQGSYAPHTNEGRGLLAHELTHSVQQSVGHSSLNAVRLDQSHASPEEREAERVRADIQSGRETVDIHEYAAPSVARLPGSPAGGCGVCYGTPGNAGTAAHAEISAAFKALNPTILAPFPFPLVPSPTSCPDDQKKGVPDLAVLRGRNSIDIGEIKPANPCGLLQGDVDLHWYEDQLKKLGFNIGRLMLPPPVQAIPFPTLAPAPCPQFQELFVDPPAHGIYTYWCIPDFAQLVGTCPCKMVPPPPVPVKEPVKEKVKEKDKKKVEEKEKEKEGPPFGVPVPAREVVTTLAVVAVLVALASKLKGAAKGRVLAYATAIAAVVLIVSGAEASVGLEGDDPLEALFKQAEAKGQTIPDDIKEAMRNDPKLRASLSKAVKTGNLDEAQREAGERLARVIAAHRDEFTEEELDILLKATEGAKGSIPNGDVTVEELKRVIEAKRKSGGAGPAPGPTAGQGGGTGGKKEETSGVEAQQPGKVGTAAPSAPPRAPEERLVEGMARKEAGGPKFTAALKEKLLAAARAVTPPLTDKEVDDLLARLQSGAGKSEEEIVDSVRKGVDALRASKGVEAGAAAPEPAEGAKKPETTSAKVATDDIVVKAKQGKKDPQTEAILEKKFGGIEAGVTLVAGPKDIVFENGKPFSGFIVGRDAAGNLFIGRGPITPRLVDGTWRLEVSAGIKLSGAAGAYGTTKRYSTPSLPGVGQRSTTLAK